MKEEIAQRGQLPGRQGGGDMRAPGPQLERELERGRDTGRGQVTGGAGPGRGVRDSDDFIMINPIVSFINQINNQPLDDE